MLESLFIHLNVNPRALKNLNKFRLHGKQITLAWAPGKGMKDKLWKDYWDLDLGCSYIPIEKVTTQVNTFKILVEVNILIILSFTGEHI